MNNILKTDADFDNAIWFKTPVEVWMYGVLEENETYIESYCESSVKILDGYFFRSNCVLRLK